MNNLEIKVSTQLPVITVNFVELEKQLREELKQFNLIVDKSSIKTARAMATQINKLSGKIDRIRIDEAKKLAAPITEFETKARELSSMCQESRQKLLSQVKVFDLKEIEECTTRLESELASTYVKYGVDEEFQEVSVNDLAIISNITKTGLAKKAKDTIDDRVLEAKQFQEKISTRLLTLEAICFKGGLHVPLARENINHFLKDSDDDVYLKKLTSLILNEITRLEKAKLLKEKQKTQKAQVIATVTEIPKVETVENVQITKVEPQLQTPYAHFKNVNEFKKKSTKRLCTVTATFEVEVEEHVVPKLRQALEKKFAKAGFKQVPIIAVTEVKNVA